MPDLRSPGPESSLLDLRGFPPRDRIETHLARIYLTSDRAYKQRKAVRYPFVDQSTLGHRQRLAMAELMLGHVLAPATYLGVRTAITDAGEEAVVEMRRFEERDTLAARLSDDRVEPGMLEQLGVRLAEFHAGCPEAASPWHRGDALALVHRNADELLELTDAEVSDRAVWELTRPLEVALLRRTADIANRAAEGRRREGHGDLRAEHVVFNDDGLQIFDRLEFDTALRTSDVGADLAFLLMDLERRGHPQAAHLVLDAYRSAGGDPGDDDLIAAWSLYRACVAIKTGLLRGALPGAPHRVSRVPELLTLARRLAWRTRDAKIIVLCGPPASGKSTIAAALADRTGRSVLSSDEERKASLALAPTEHAPQQAYSAEHTDAVYRALGRRSSALVRTNGVAIVDATMATLVRRAAFAHATDDPRQVLYVECRAPAAELARRAARRLDDATTTSDATPAIAARLRDGWEPLDEIPAGRHLPMRSDRPVSAFLDDLEARMDRLDGAFDALDDGFDRLASCAPIAQLPETATV